MFEIGNYVMKKGTGVCIIKDINYLDDSHVSEKMLYYFLVPFEDEKTNVYVPVEKADVMMRGLLSKEEAMDLIKKIPDIAPLEIKDEKMRDKEFKAALQTMIPETWVSLIKLLYNREQSRISQGKSNTVLDKNFFHQVEDYLHSELAIALDHDKQDICRLIGNTLPTLD